LGKNLRLLWLNSIGAEAPGTINRVLPLSRELARHGYEIDMPFFNIDHIRSQLYKAPKFRSILWNFSNNFFPHTTRFIFPPASLEDFSTFFSSLRRYYRSFKFDAIYITKPLLGSAGAGLLLARKHKVPLILDLDDYDIHPENHLLWDFNGIVVASQELKRLFKKFAPLYIPNSTDLELFNPSKYDAKKTSPPLIVWSGMMFERIRVETIIEAFKLMRENAKLMFMGKGPKRQALINYAKLLHLEDKVIFSEWLNRTEVPARLAKSSIAIIYLSDTLGERCKCPGKMYEYMAMELPVIATDVGEAAYTVRKAKCGLVVPPDDPRALAEAMDYLVQNPDQRRKMGKSGREFLVKEQNYGILGLRLKEFIELVCGRASAS
jgi:glycosyltransferase involved in cell wall biosynthesis